MVVEFETNELVQLLHDVRVLEPELVVVAVAVVVEEEADLDENVNVDVNVNVERVVGMKDSDRNPYLERVDEGGVDVVQIHRELLQLQRQLLHWKQIVVELHNYYYW